MRMQTFVEPTFEFRVLADPFATYNYVELPVQPTIPVVAGPPVTWKAVLPTLAPLRRAVSPGLQGRGQLGQSQRSGRRARSRSAPAGRSPGFPRISPCGAASTRRSIEDLSVAEPGDSARSRCSTPSGRLLCTSNPMRIVAEASAAALLVRPARPVGGDDRHQFGARADRVRARPRLPRRHEPPGQRFPDHDAVLERTQRADARIQRGRPVHHLPGLRMVGQHRAGR